MKKTLILMLLFCTPTQSGEEEFLPVARPSLSYWRLKPADFSRPQIPEKTLDIRSIIASELSSIGQIPALSGKTGSSFKDVIENIPIEGRFEVVESYARVSDSYIRSIERTIRAHIFPPIIARTLQQPSTVSVVFLVARDGRVEGLQKENTTGSPPLDATAMNACRSSSPLPTTDISDPNVKHILKMRFTLTFNP